MLHLTKIGGIDYLIQKPVSEIENQRPKTNPQKSFNHCRFHFWSRHFNDWAHHSPNFYGNVKSSKWASTQHFYVLLFMVRFFDCSIFNGVGISTIQ